MHIKEFVQIRRYLGKSQVQLGRLLSVSPKAIQSYEQGWRSIPASVERQLLFLVYLTRSSKKNAKSCWEIKNCPSGWRHKCAAWEYKVGDLCWFVNGTFCQGEYNDIWDKKMQLCRECEVLRRVTDVIKDNK